jgi:diaminopropionate ammonia-lyase
VTGARTDPYRNPGARDWRTAERAAGVAGFHRSLPGYAVTRLVPVPGLARELGVRSVFVKEEASRLGLPAFKVLGASYAVSMALSERYRAGGRVLPLDKLRAAAADHDPVELIAATDGNHGRAVAHFAGLLGLPSRIFFPTGISAAASAAISAEATQAVELGLPYDGVVNAAKEAAASAGDAAVLIQDTSWPGYEQIPEWITDGYSTLFLEADEQLTAAGAGPPGLVAVPVGVGALAHAAVRHYRSGGAPGGAPGGAAPTVLSVEPANAPAILSSLHAGRAVTVPTGQTVMAGLNCGTPSASAWPELQAGLDAAVTVTDGEAVRAVRDLQAAGVDSGPCGAAALAGVRALARTGSLAADTTVLLLSTEGRAANPLPEGTA